MTWDKSVIKISDQVPITIHYDKNVTLQCCMITRAYTELWSLCLWQDVSPLIRTITLPTWRSYFCSGTLNLGILVYIQCGGLEDKVGWEFWDSIWEATWNDISKRAACQYGKQVINSKYGAMQRKEK